MISEGTCQTGLLEYSFHLSPSGENEMNSPSYVKRIPRNRRSAGVCGRGSRAMDRTPLSACEPAGNQFRAVDSPNFAKFNSGFVQCKPSIEVATPMR